MEKTLNPQQKLAAEATHGPLLIIAGAGTGKTRTLTSRIIHLIKEGLSPEKICALTFTNKAAGEMEERVYKFISYADAQVDKFDSKNLQTYKLNNSQTNRPWIGTFHSLGAKILRKETHLLGRKPNFVIFDSDDSFSLVKEIVKKFFPKKCGEGKNRSKYESPAFFTKQIGEFKNLGEGPEEIIRRAKTANEAALKIFLEYENRLEKNNAFDFDDLIEKPVALFKKYPELLKKYQSRFEAILVDEYQDLNPKQYELIRLLAGGHKNLSVVGDDEQMIYGWRYADIKIFLNFERDWPGAKIAFLEENYRSTGNIIRAAQSVAENNQYRRPKNLWTKNPDGAPIKIIEAENEEQEAGWVAEQIFNYQLSIINKNEAMVANKVENCKLKIENSTAVLYRTNAQSRAIEQALIRRQIPYKIFGGVRFYERKEIKDVVAAMRLVWNPKDTISRERLEKNLSKSRFSGLEAALTEAKTGTPPQLIKAFLEATDYLGYLDRNFTNADERRENIAELINFASKYEDLGRFLEEVALMQPLDASSVKSRGSSSEKNLTTNHQPLITHLMTIHLSKGLEFDCVFIAGASEGLLPHAMSMDNDYQLEEERRLMYVAMTRAKQELNISFYDMPSRFIGEIPPGFTEYLNFSNGGNEPALADFENYISLEE